MVSSSRSPSPRSREIDSETPPRSEESAIHCSPTATASPTAFPRACRSTVTARAVWATEGCSFACNPVPPIFSGHSSDPPKSTRSARRLSVSSAARSESGARRITASRAVVRMTGRVRRCCHRGRGSSGVSCRCRGRRRGAAEPQEPGGLDRGIFAVLARQPTMRPSADGEVEHPTDESGVLGSSPPSTVSVLSTYAVDSATGRCWRGAPDCASNRADGPCRRDTAVPSRRRGRRRTPAGAAGWRAWARPPPRRPGATEDAASRPIESRDECSAAVEQVVERLQLVLGREGLPPSHCAKVGRLTLRRSAAWPCVSPARSRSSRSNSAKSG